MKREVATLPADLPHAFKSRPPGHEDGTCDVCDREVGVQLHQELVIEKAEAPTPLVREKGV